MSGVGSSLEELARGKVLLAMRKKILARGRIFPAGENISPARRKKILERGKKNFPKKQSEKVAVNRFGVRAGGRFFGNKRAKARTPNLWVFGALRTRAAFQTACKQECGTVFVGIWLAMSAA